MRYLTACIFGIAYLLTACNKNDDESTFLFLEGLELSIPENPQQNELLGKLTWEASERYVNFSLKNERPFGAIELNDIGEITVKSASLFDFESNPIITATAILRVGDLLDSAEITLTVLDVEERTFYTGPMITFSKVSFADFSLAENQDRITDKVWLTRANFEGLFNIRAEGDFDALSPAGTEWAKGTLTELDQLTFSPWISAFGNDPKSQIGESFVVHLIEENIYLDFTLLSWVNGRLDGGGGGFSYERSTP